MDMGQFLLSLQATPMTLDRQALQNRFAELFDLADPAEVSAIFGDIYALYTGTDRHYHGMAHIADCLAEFDRVCDLANDPMAMEMAIWFHDVYYDGTRPDNELRSAHLADAALWRLGVSGARRAIVRELILDTHHAKRPRTEDGELLVDIDLSSLAAQPDIFDDNTAKIREEFSHISDEAYTAGRQVFFRKMLARPSIYYTAEYRARSEAAARANLQRAADR